MDKVNYKELKRREKVLNLEAAMQVKGGQRDRSSITILCYDTYELFQKINEKRVQVGQACLALSCLMVFSMFITNLDRFLHSECGFQCGYLLDSPSYSNLNLLDYILQRLSSKHNYIINMELFLDIALFILMTLYVLICIFYAIGKIGINYFSYGGIYKVKRQETLP